MRAGADWAARLGGAGGVEVALGLEKPWWSVLICLDTTYFVLMTSISCVGVPQALLPVVFMLAGAQSSKQVHVSNADRPLNILRRVHSPFLISYPTCPATVRRMEEALVALLDDVHSQASSCALCHSQSCALRWHAQMHPCQL